MAAYINGYALALLSLSKEEKKLKAYKEQSLALIEAFELNEDYIGVLNTKSIPVETRRDLAKKAFGKKISKNILNFMFLLIERSKVNLAIPVLKKLVKLINEDMNIDEGTVYSVIPLSKLEVTKIEKKTSTILGKKVVLINKIDKELISGIKVIVQDEVIEDSVISRFEQLRQTLLEREDI